METTGAFTGAELDAAVAKAEGVTGLIEKDGRMCHVREWDPEGHSWRDSLSDWVMWVDYAPSQRWDHGGPIIEREGINIITRSNPEMGGNNWLASYGGRLHTRAAGPTPLIAAMRCFVASRQ
jgi:hypothetical protein